MSQSLKSRFEGNEGQRRLIDALKNQLLIEHDENLAAALAAEGQIVEFQTGDVLITQGSGENEAYFILDGSANIYINARHVATRTRNESVGEMALIDPQVRRSATVTAANTITAFKITEDKFRAITANNTKIWMALSKVIAERLRERSKFHRAPNDMPVLFIGSSVEGLPLAQEIQVALKHDHIRVRPWNTPGVFGTGGVSIDELLKEVDQSDFAAFIFGPDDQVFSRSAQHEAPRDNVIFELGLFMGKLDRRRSFIVKDQNAVIKIPSDLLGVTPITYVSKQGDDLSSHASVIATELRRVIKHMGVI